MGYFSYLREGGKDLLRGIRRHKLLFGFLILTQAAIFGLLIYLLLNYPVQILSNVQGIMEPLGRANYNASSLQEGAPFSTELLGVYQSYQSMVRLVAELLLWLGGIFLFLEVGMWTFSHRLLEEREPSGGWKKETSNMILWWLRAWLSILVLVLLPLILGYYIIKTTFLTAPENLNLNFPKTGGAILLALIYFLLTSFALINSDNRRKFIKSWGRVAFKKIPFTLLTLIINLAVISFLFWIIYLLMPYPSLFILTIALSIILLFSLVLARIYWSACLKRLAEVT